MFSETGSIMRQTIENALGYCSAGILATEALLEGPPGTRMDISRAIGSLHKSIYRLDAEVSNIERVELEILDEKFAVVRGNMDKVESQLDMLSERGSDDPLVFVLWASKLLPPLRSLKQALIDMESARKENTKMNRAV